MKMCLGIVGIAFAAPFIAEMFIILSFVAETLNTVSGLIAGS